jgi:2-methylcitrate dehydratase PrpD
MTAVSKKPVAAVLAAFASRMSADEIPEAVGHEAKLHILDALGCALAARASGEQAAALSVARRRAGRGACTVVGGDRRIDALWAAFANGVLVQAMDYDDTHADAVCHVSSVIVPTVLATAEEYSGNGADALAAFVLGAEITSRLGAASTGDFISRGLHPTSVCGVFGATAVAASATGLDSAQIAHAFGIAGSHSAGILACLAEGVPVKPLHAGAAARNGILCAELAAEGAPGPRGVLEGPAGLFPAFTGDSHEAALREQCEDLGERWMTADIAVKAMPVCHYQQGCLEAARGISIGAAEIESVELGIDAAGIAIVLDPLVEKVRPQSTYQARFSLPYCAAVTLVHGQIDLADLTASVGEPEVERLAESVTNFALEPGARSDFAGEVIVRLKNGETRRQLVEHPLGTPGRPMSEADVLSKYRENAALGLGDGEVAELERSVLDLESLTTLEPITGLLASCRS